MNALGSRRLSLKVRELPRRVRAKKFHPPVSAWNPGVEYGARLTFRRPMLDMSAAKAVTGWDEDRVLQEINEGRILWAFNLGTGGKTFVLILARSLACYYNPLLAQPKTVESVANLVLPGHTRMTGQVRGVELQYAFNVTSQQVLKLRHAGLLKESSRSRIGRGRDGSPLFTRASVVEFLTKRRFC